MTIIGDPRGSGQDGNQYLHDAVWSPVGITEKGRKLVLGNADAHQAVEIRHSLRGPGRRGQGPEARHELNLGVA